MLNLAEHFAQTFDDGIVFCEGTTDFFRYPNNLQLLVDYALSCPEGSLKKFLFAPSSIGCEPFSFAMLADKVGVFERHPDLHLFGLDLSEDFLSLARAANYPNNASYNRLISKGFGDYVQSHPDSRLMFRIADSIQSRVTFLPAQDIRDHQPEGGLYDATICLNLLLHLSQDEQSAERRQMFGHIASITNGLICVNDAEDVKKQDIIDFSRQERAGFVSLSDHFSGNSKPIHKKASVAAYEVLLGYHERDDSRSTICLVKHGL